MQHVAIMQKSWGFTEKILSCDKTIESRWYKTRRAPWNKIAENDIIYFKNSGESIGLKTTVGKVLQFAELTPLRARKIVDEYAQAIGLEQSEIPKFYERIKNKRYCILIFLKNATTIVPFEIDKSGYGSMSAWITVPHVELLKI